VRLILCTYTDLSRCGLLDYWSRRLVQNIMAATCLGVGKGLGTNSSCSTGYPPYSAGIWPLCMQQGDATTRGQFWNGGNVSAGAIDGLCR
jgi:hypothetical protein